MAAAAGCGVVYIHCCYTSSSDAGNNDAVRYRGYIIIWS